MATKKLNTEEFIKRARKIHGDKYDYSKANYENMRTKISIICKIHGVFLQRPNSHLNNGKGCFDCSYYERRRTLNEFINEANKIHDNKYDYSKVNYVNNKTKVIIICKIHGEFQQKPTQHINTGCGCEKCGFKIISNKLKSNNEEFIKKSNSIYNNKYDYSNINYVNNHTYIKIKCNNHGIIFQQQPQKHLDGNEGCPKCKNNGYSKEQIKWLEFLSKFNNIYIQHALNEGEYKIPKTKYKADGYCKENNTIYEFNGGLWHGDLRIYNPKDINPITNTTFGELYNKTLNKEKKIKELGYNLIVIWEYDWKKINKSIKILQRKFKMST